MQDAGIVTHILQKWTPQKKRCKPLDVTSKIGFTQARTAFLVLATGMGLALVTAAVEVWRGATLGYLTSRITRMLSLLMHTNREN